MAVDLINTPLFFRSNLKHPIVAMSSGADFRFGSGIIKIE
jgi:hypothetical protein